MPVYAAIDIYAAMPYAMLLLDAYADICRRCFAARYAATRHVTISLPHDIIRVERHAMIRR